MKLTREEVIETVKSAHGNGETPNLRQADLWWVDLNEADLQGADLSQAYLRRACLSQANLQGTELGAADLSGADLRGTNLVLDPATPLMEDMEPALLDFIKASLPDTF
jgi:hypothetical protein